MHWMVLATIIGMSAVIGWRIRETRRPLTAARIIIPPLGMSTGFVMFVLEPFQMPWLWALVAFLAGFLVFSYPLIRTSVLVRAGSDVILRGSPAFLVVILVLALVRFALRGYVETLITPMQTAGLFFILAFGMIVRWRTHMLRSFRTVRESLT